MHLATDTATAEYNGDYIVIAVPSGKIMVEIAITPAQGQMLARQLLTASDDAFATHAKPLPQCEIIEGWQAVVT